MLSWVDFWSHAQSEVDDLRQGQKGIFLLWQTGQGWVVCSFRSLSLSLWKAEQRHRGARVMGAPPVTAASDSCRAGSPQTCPSDCVDAPCARSVSEPALRRVRKPLESWGTSAFMPSLSHSQRHLRPAFPVQGRGPTRFLPCVCTVLGPCLLTKQLEW